MNDGLTSTDNLNSDEFDTVFELIIAVAFMFIGVLAIIYMNGTLLDKSEVISYKDKVVVVRSAMNTEVNNPFRFTPYQAYMMAWHMDGKSYEPLSYVGSSSAGDAYTDGADDIHATIDPTDSKKYLNKSFITYRNQTITGKNGLESDHTLSVRKAMLNAGLIEPDETSYWKQANRWTLSLTDKYKLDYDLGDPAYTFNGGKTFQWVLEPTR